MNVRFHTGLGDVVICVDVAAAPITSANFLKYVENGWYDGSAFYRAVRLDDPHPVPIGCIQGGLDKEHVLAPPIAHETTRATGLSHRDGTITMARAEVGSAQGEFAICVGMNRALDYGGARNTDGQGFAAFGQVVEGMAIVRLIQERPRGLGDRLEDPVIIFSADRIRS